MTTLILAIALIGHLWSPEENAASLKCFELEDNQKVCIEEEKENSQGPMTSDEFLIQEVNQVIRYDV